MYIKLTPIIVITSATLQRFQAFSHKDKRGSQIYSTYLWLPNIGLEQFDPKQLSANVVIENKIRIAISSLNIIKVRYQIQICLRSE